MLIRMSISLNFNHVNFKVSEYWIISAAVGGAAVAIDTGTDATANTDTDDAAAAVSVDAADTGADAATNTDADAAAVAAADIAADSS
ncbi:unnamed protein product, partial [Rhizophagus irregularis]